MGEGKDDMNFKRSLYPGERILSSSDEQLRSGDCQGKKDKGLV